MSKYYRYNGVKLPALPKDVVDKYPYIVILFEHDRGYGSFYSFHASTESSELEKIWYSADNAYQTELLQRGKGVSYYIKKDQSDIWTRLHDEVDGSESASAPYWYNDVLVNSLGVLLKSVVWTNHNIYNTEGGLEYAANDAPVPVPDIDLKSWLTGYALGLAGKPMPMGMRKPVAYLYNSVKLPPLPECDKETYPYAVLYKTLLSYRLCYLKHIQYTRNTETGKTLLVIPKTSIRYRNMTMGDNKGVWEELPLDADSEIILAVRTGSLPSSSGIEWTNVTLVDLDGNTVIKASDPIPVYE